jgi:hypothetical protein
MKYSCQEKKKLDQASRPNYQLRGNMGNHRDKLNNTTGSKQALKIKHTLRGK